MTGAFVQHIPWRRCPALPRSVRLGDCASSASTYAPGRCVTRRARKTPPRQAPANGVTQTCSLSIAAKNVFRH